MTQALYPIWDLLQRLSHWCYPVLILFSWWTAENARMDWHAVSGYCLLMLVLWRIYWGFKGSHYAQFKHFVPSPRTVIDYVRGATGPYLGHNPLGALSVLVLLSLLLVQSVSGLFNTDDLFLEGPLVVFVTDATVAWASAIHEWSWLLLQGFIVLHLLAIAFHQFYKGERLIQNMLFGRWLVRESDVVSSSTLRGLIALVVVVALVVGIGLLIPEPEPTLW